MIEAMLAPGGRFYMAERHPIGETIASIDGKTVTVERSYFDTDEPNRIDEDGSYADEDAELGHTTRYEWTHSLDDLIGSLAAVGLRIEFVHEFPFAEVQRFPAMEQSEDGRWRFPDGAPTLPLIFSLEATKPAST